MSEQSRGPLIQRQGYVKRAPSGKLSAFKKWEKKWCVFALSKRCGPVLDFFDERSGTGSGPAGAIGRVELTSTKQVCAAINCKVPYTFIIVTESKILSLAALSQSDADSWISCLRRVLTNQSCLQSSEDHTYETSGNAMTRQEQERLSRAKRRPPTPPGSGSEEGYPLSDQGPPISSPPPPLVRNSTIESSVSPAPPTLPKRATKREALPPPVPTSNRPRLKDRESSLSPPTTQSLRNVLDVLRNYDDSPDTTYESGHRGAINNAASSRTLDSKMLANALQDYQDIPKSKTLTSSSPPPIYSRIKKQKEEVPKRPVIAPRRRNTIQQRMENDFAPVHGRQAVATPSSDSDSESSEDDVDVVLGELMAAKACDLDEIGDDAEDTYTSMDGMFEASSEVQNNFSHLSSLAGSQNADEDADRYMELPITGSDRSGWQEQSILVQPSMPEQPRLPPKESKLSKVTRSNSLEQPKLPAKESKLPEATSSVLPQQPALSSNKSNLSETANSVSLSSECDSVYENSKTIISDDKKTPKAVPTAAPRRAATVSANLLARQSPPKPSVRARRPQSTVTGQMQDEYENFLGEFGIGVSSKPTASAGSTVKGKTNGVERMSSKFTRLHMASKKSSLDLPLPPTPDELEPPLLASAPFTTAPIPLADEESSGSQTSPRHTDSDKSRSGTFNYDKQMQQTDTPSTQDIVTSIDNRNHLPCEEAPPPYTPPRILTNVQRNPSITCIIEGDTEDEEECSNNLSEKASFTNPMPSQSVEIPEVNTSSNLSYDSHPAFTRSPKFGKATRVHKIQSACQDQAVQSPHTPPGTPPAPTRRKSAPARPHEFTLSTLNNNNEQSEEDVVLRLEDSFPKMKQSNRNRGSYLEDVVAVSPTSAVNRGSKPGLRKSFSVNSPSWKNVDRFNFDLNTTAPVFQPKSPASSSAVAEYDHVIKQRLAKAKQPIVRSDTSSDEAAGPVVQRRPKKSADLKQRRKSAPPNSLPVPPSQEPEASGAGRESPSLVKHPKERRRKQPLDGGTLLREGKTFKAPARDSTNLTLKQAQTQLLQEEIAHSYGVKVTVWRKDVKYALFVDMMNFVWVAGWNQKERPLLQSVFHIGDKILSVNNEPVVSASKLTKMIKRSDSETKYEFVLRRLPFGKAYFVHRNLNYESIGIELKGDSAELIHIEKGGLLAQQGLRLNPNRAFGSGQCHWVITEVNHRPLSLLAADTEANARLSAVGKDVSFVVQPMDFVELLKKTFKASSSFKDFVVN